MLKQSFTAENFRRIFDFEERKGLDLAGKFFPEIDEITKDIQACKKRYRELKRFRSTLSEEEYKEKKQAIGDESNQLKERKETLFTQELNKICAEIAKKGFRIKLKVVTGRSGKTAYSIESDASSYFAIKQIQFNLQRLYKVRQSNRYNVIRQLTNILNNDFPKYLIRTDIDDFYESIPRDKILAKINRDQLLTQTSKKIIRNIFSEYKRLSKSDIGLPRGIGISAYLSELYMRAFDDAVKKDPRVVFYARYVDDIVVVFSPEEGTDISTYWKFLRETLNDEQMGLEFNDGENGRADKTEKLDVTDRHNHKIEYLGYEIQFGVGHGSPKLDFSSKKIKRYEKRIILAFNEYERHRKTNNKAAQKLLIKRALFLTGNTRLVNSKRHAMVGIFYSNNLLTEEKALNDLDHLFRENVDKLNDGSLKNRLKRLSFKQGFQQKIFYKFTTTNLSEIVKPWKNEA